MGFGSMQRLAAPACFVLATLATAPATAATVVILPSPGSMSQPRIYSDGSGDSSIYVCSALSDLRSGRCSVQRGSPRRHR
jgi:hypothetical protein